MKSRFSSFIACTFIALAFIAAPSIAAPPLSEEQIGRTCSVISQVASTISDMRNMDIPLHMTRAAMGDDHLLLSLVESAYTLPYHGIGTEDAIAQRERFSAGVYSDCTASLIADPDWLIFASN